MHDIATMRYSAARVPFVKKCGNASPPHSKGFGTKRERICFYPSAFRIFVVLRRLNIA